jgi:hypothetical protein
LFRLWPSVSSCLSRAHWAVPTAPQSADSSELTPGVRRFLALYRKRFDRNVTPTELGRLVDAMYMRECMFGVCASPWDASIAGVAEVHAARQNCMHRPTLRAACVHPELSQAGLSAYPQPLSAPQQATTDLLIPPPLPGGCMHVRMHPLAQPLAENNFIRTYSTDLMLVLWRALAAAFTRSQVDVTGVTARLVTPPPPPLSSRPSSAASAWPAAGLVLPPYAFFPVHGPQTHSSHSCAYTCWVKCMTAGL